MAPRRIKVPKKIVKDSILKPKLSKPPLFRAKLKETEPNEVESKVPETEIDYEARKRAYNKYLNFIKREKSEGLKVLDKSDLRDFDGYVMHTKNRKENRSIYVFGRRLRRQLILNVIQKYVREKYRQHIRRRNVNAFLTSMRAAMLVHSDKLQSSINARLLAMKELAAGLLYPLRFHLFHKKAFTVEQGLALSLEERVQVVRKALKDLESTLKFYETSILPLANGNAASKQVLTEIYSDLLGRLADMEEYKKLMQVETRMKCKVLPDIAKSMKSEIFDTKERVRVNPIELLDFKEYCMANRHYEALKVVDKALLDVGILL